MAIPLGKAALELPGWSDEIMNTSIIRNLATAEQIRIHLERCDSAFVPPLSQTVDLKSYAVKIYTHAERFERWKGGQLVALVAAYLNAADKSEAFITNVSVLPEYQGRGLAKSLIMECLDEARRREFQTLALEVDDGNRQAVKLYDNLGFVAGLRGPRHRIINLK